LRSLDAVTSTGVGVIGFCMGGGLALLAASRRPDAVVACAPFYGVIPWQQAEPDWSALTAVVRGHYAAEDAMFPPAKVQALETELRALGKDVAFEIHPGTDHAFFNNDRPEVHHPEAAARAWDATVAFFAEVIR
jgi:carboxymethylenebutenolidase